MQFFSILSSIDCFSIKIDTLKIGLSFQTFFLVQKKLTVDFGSETGAIKNGILEKNRNNNKCSQMNEIEQMKKCKERLIDMIDFNRHVMKRILNHCFLDEPQLVYLSQSQVEIIDQVANVCRPG